jgi:hypothetical protein
MPDEAAEPSEASRPAHLPASAARSPERRGRTLTSALFLAFSVLFIGWCTADITLAVFASDTPAGSSGGAPEAACANGVQGLAAAVERALALRTPAPGRPPATLSSFEDALAPEWNEAGPIEARCASTARGARAYAAVARFRTGAREAMHHDVELAPLRQEIAPYLATN